MPAVQPPKLARLLFPNAQPHLQRRGLRQLYVALVVGACIAVAFSTVVYHLAESGQLK